MRSGRFIIRKVRSIALCSSGLYQKKNCRWASLSAGVLALNTGCRVYGSEPVYHASVLTVMGVGVKSCTCSRWKSNPLVITANSAISSAVHPGCELMKYGIICCLNPSALLIRSKIFLNCLNCSNEGLRMCMSTLSLVCSGATFSRPLT